MNKDSLETLRGFATTIGDQSRSLQSVEAPVLQYGVFLRNILNSLRPNFTQQRESQESTQAESGLAIAPWNAAACMEDRIRTAAFIRGSIRAVERALKTTSNRPLHLVEAGCGPLGTLTLPLLAYFDETELEVSLVDIHEESIVSVDCLLKHFEFHSRVKQLVCGDVLRISIDSPADIVLTETMNVALSHEPQVEITRALMKNHANAILIPESIRVDVAMINIEQEHSQFPPQPLDRELLGTVFELDRKSAINLPEQNGFLPAGSVRVPDDQHANHVACLVTTVRVSDDVVFSDYDSQISIPAPLFHQDQMPALSGRELSFAYRLGESPGLTLQVGGESVGN